MTSTITTSVVVRVVLLGLASMTVQSSAQVPAVAGSAYASTALAPAHARAVLGNCSRCGKKILFGNTCASCKAIELREKAAEASRRAAEAAREKAAEATRRAAEAARAKAAEASRRASEAGRRATDTIRSRSQPVIESATNRARESFSRTAEGVAPRVRTIVEKSSDAVRTRVEEALRRIPEADYSRYRDTIEAAKERYGALASAHLAEVLADGRSKILPAFKSFLERSGPAVARWSSDPVNQEKVFAGVRTALQLRERYHAAKSEALGRAVDFLGNQVKVEVGGRRMSLNQATGEFIRDRMPALEGSSLATEPVEALAYTLVAGDREYVFREMKIVRDRQGRFVSCEELLLDSSPLKHGTTEQALNGLEAMVQLRSALRTGEGLPEAVERVAAMQRERN